jgi:SAM-dependent methyltransferase
MTEAPRITLSVPAAVRASYLASIYADSVQDIDALEGLLARLPGRHGRKAVAAWRGLADAGEFEALSAALIEAHYDPAYARSSRTETRRVLGTIDLEGLRDADQEAAADAIAAIVEPSRPSGRPLPRGTQGYAAVAQRSLELALPFDRTQVPVMHLIPEAPARVLDIGSGAGHNAAWLAGRGYRVVAAEPTPELLEGARRLYAGSGVEWLNDALPELRTLGARSESFDLVLIIAVWMHLDPEDRPEAMREAAKLLRPGGRLILSLRHGPVPPGRRMFEITPEETIAQAEAEGLKAILNVAAPSVQEVNIRAGVTWDWLAFERPA